MADIRQVSRGVAFWFLTLLLGLFLAAASAPSPLYSMYQAAWHFSAATLTSVYAVYAGGALAALLLTGRLSDHIGRRTVTALGTLIQLGAILAFLAAGSVEMLFLARTLQGVGTGVATAAISAWLLDLQPPTHPRLGSLMAGVALVGGLGLGALVSGTLVELVGDPLHFVFWLLLGLFAVALLTLGLLPDDAPRAPGWLASLRPKVGVPAEASSAFLVTAPSMVAVWAVGGFYLSLGPSLAISLTGGPSHVAGGAVIAALLCTAALASFVTATTDPRKTMAAGSAVLAIGVALTLAAVWTDSLVGLIGASIVAGMGFGPAFSAILRRVAPLAPPTRRGGLLAALYLELYLSFSLPTVAAGFAAGPWGLLPVTYVFGAIVIALASVTAVLASRP